MKTLLLVLPPNKPSLAARQYAIERARSEHARLVAAVVLDPELAHKMTGTLTDVGFMGEKLGERVAEAIEREYQDRAQVLLQEVAAEAAAAGVSCDKLIRTGDPGDVLPEVTRSVGADLAVLVSERRSWLGRFLSRGAPLRLPALPGCEVKVVEEEE